MVKMGNMRHMKNKARTGNIGHEGNLVKCGKHWKIWETWENMGNMRKCENDTSLFVTDLINDAHLYDTCMNVMTRHSSQHNTKLGHSAEAMLDQ